eukprot:623994-Rhodomonas_salina.2
MSRTSNPDVTPNIHVARRSSSRALAPTALDPNFVSGQPIHAQNLLLLRRYDLSPCPSGAARKREVNVQSRSSRCNAEERGRRAARRREGEGWGAKRGRRPTWRLEGEARC